MGFIYAVCRLLNINTKDKKRLDLEREIIEKLHEIREGGYV